MKPNDHTVANTYTNLYIQIIFAVKGRENLIIEKYREEVEKYICGIISNKDSKPLAIYCNPDHVHVLIGIHPAISISNMAKEIKSNSSKWINQKGWLRGKFSWQNGFGAFSYSKSHLDSVAKYILRQPEHHKRTTFKEEYLDILRKRDVAYDEQYLFEWYD